MNEDGMTNNPTVAGVEITLPRVVTLAAPVGAWLLTNLASFKTLDVAVQITLVGLIGAVAITLIVCYAWVLISNKELAKAKVYAKNAPGFGALPASDAAESAE